MLRLRWPPLTIALIAALVVVGVAVGAPTTPLPAEYAQRHGFAPADLRGGGWHRIATSLLFTAGGISFWKVLGLTAVSCGPLEELRGGRTMAAVFATVHVATLLVEAAAIGAAAACGVAWGRALDAVPDVGPSAGCYGCLGALLPVAPPRLRLAIVAAAVAAVAVNLTVHVRAQAWAGIDSDVGHAIALAFGAGLGAVLRLDRPRGEGA